MRPGHGKRVRTARAIRSSIVLAIALLAIPAPRIAGASSVDEPGLIERLQTIRDGLDDLDRSLSRGDHEGARALALRLYLDEFETIEGWWGPGGPHATPALASHVRDAEAAFHAVIQADDSALRDAAGRLREALEPIDREARRPGVVLQPDAREPVGVSRRRERHRTRRPPPDGVRGDRLARGRARASPDSVRRRRSGSRARRGRARLPGRVRAARVPPAVGSRRPDRARHPPVAPPFDPRGRPSGGGRRRVRGALRGPRARRRAALRRRVVLVRRRQRVRDHLPGRPRGRAPDRGHPRVHVPHVGERAPSCGRFGWA